MNRLEMLSSQGEVSVGPQRRMLGSEVSKVEPFSMMTWSGAWPWQRVAEAK